MHSVCEHPEDGFCAIDPESEEKTAAKPIKPRRKRAAASRTVKTCQDCGMDISFQQHNSKRCRRCRATYRAQREQRRRQGLPGVAGETV